jgi:tripartite-type tricarboxylate transporter receptor subunit TctC
MNRFQLASQCPAASHVAAAERNASGFTRRALLKAVGAITIFAPALSRAQENRVVRIIVPFSPGAATDVVARLLAPELSRHLGKSVVVENRPGGRTIVGADAVARSEPDGNTLLLSMDDSFTIVRQLIRSGAPDPFKDLMPVNMLGIIPMAVVAPPTLPIDSFSDLVAYARKHPGALSYGSPGSGSLTQLVMEMLKVRAKIDVTHVPYRGMELVRVGLLSGDVQIGIMGYGNTKSLIDEGKLKLLAIASPERVTGAPNIATTAESGYPEVDATSRLLLAGPAKMSTAIVARLNDVIMEILKTPEMKQRLESRDIMVKGIASEDLADSLKKIYAANAEAIKAAGVQPE